MGDIVLILEIIGTAAFAISGAAVSINKHLDIFGVLFCALTTAFGGGVMRDVILGNLPPTMFRNYIYVSVAVGVAVLTFVVAKAFKKFYLKEITVIDKVNNIFDAAGLGVFTVTGINIAIASGYADNMFFVIFLGMTTGCGGGIVRDVLVREVPFVLSKRIYAVASIAGGIVYYFMFVTFSLGEVLSVICSIMVIFILRILASIFHWDLPKAF